MGPNIEPCGTHDKSIWKTLSVSFIFTSCFLHFKMACVVKIILVFDGLILLSFDNTNQAMQNSIQKYR